MEAIKNAIGLGTTAQEGREPVSGLQGSGTAGEPYDQGNVDDSSLGGKPAQHTDPTIDSTTNPSVTSTTSFSSPYTIGSGLGSNATSGHNTSGLTSSDGVTPNTASATSASGPVIDPTSSNATSGPHGSDLANRADPRVDSDNDRHATSGPHASDLANKTDPRVDSDNDRHLASGVDSSLAGRSTSTSNADPVATEQSQQTGGIGSSSWFSTAGLPFIGKGNKPATETSQPTTSTAAVSDTTSHALPEQTSSNKSTGLEDIKSQPPNNLPTNVPTGTSTDFAAPGSPPSSSHSTTAATTGTIPSSSTSDPMHAHQDLPNEPVGGLSQPSTNPSHSLTGSRGSIAPTKPDHANAPLKPAEKGGEHANNPSAIPTAGGKKIGEDAYTERKSLQVDAADVPATGLTGGETTAPTTTSAKTARNVGTAEAAGVGAVSGTGQEGKKASIGSGGSESEHKKEKKGLVEKIKEKVHHHKEKKSG